MRTTPSGVYTSVTAAAALLVLMLIGATGPTPSSAASSESSLTSDNFKGNCGTPTRYATIIWSNTVWARTTPTRALVVNASYNYGLFRDYQDRAVCCISKYPLSPEFQTPSVGKPSTNPDRSTATPTPSSATCSDTTAAQTSSATSYHDSSGGGGHEGTDNESSWGRFRHEPLRLPDQFMARFLNTLMYLAVVITADVIAALLFGRWRPRYYQRSRRNRLNWKRRMRFRRFRMNAADVVVRIWDACVQLHHTLRVDQDDVSGPTYQMISNIQSTAYPATLSTFADLPTSAIIVTMTMTRRSALIPIAPMSAPTSSAFPDLSLLASRGACFEASTLNLGPPVSPRQRLLLKASEMSVVASCHPRASLPDAGLEIALRLSVSPRSPLLLTAAPPSTRPSRARSQCLPEAADREIKLLAERPLTARCPSATAPTTKCAGMSWNNTHRPIFKTSNTAREWLAVLGLNLVLESLSSPYPATSPAARSYRPALVAADTDYRNAEGTINTLMRYNAAEHSVTTAVEEFGGGQAETADEAPPSPFFVSEHYTPESTCFVSAHGVAYTTIIMSYTHQFNYPTKGDSQEDTPITTGAGDVPDILWPAMNARIRCKWSQACVQTSSSEYYRSSVEAGFASCFIPDEPEMAMLNELVRKHL